MGDNALQKDLFYKISTGDKTVSEAIKASISMSELPEVDLEGHHFIDFGKLPEVEKFLESALEQSPYAIDLHTHYSMTLIRQGKYEEAEAHWKALVDDEPENPDLNICYIQMLRVNQRFNIASKKIEQTFRLDGLTNDQKIILNELNAGL